MANQNLELLIVAAKLLRPVLDDLVFVGGCATGLLVTDEAAAEARKPDPREDRRDGRQGHHLVCRGSRVHRVRLS